MEACGRIGVLGFTSMLLCGAFLVGQSKGLKNCSKLPHAVSGIFNSISSSNNLVLNIFFGSTILLRVLENLRTLMYLYASMGLVGQRGRRVLKITKCMIFGQYQSTSTSKDLVWIHFLVVQILETFGRMWAHGCTYLLSICGFWVGQRGQKFIKMTKYTTFWQYNSNFTSKT